jgi:rhodanese-related sulfurtransferase
MPREITVHQLAEAQAAGQRVYLLDVRQPWEHELAALPGSVLIPLHELPYRLEEVRPPADARVIVYCHHGIRSRTGAALLEQAGIPNPLSLAGGIDAWSRHVDPSIPLY